MSKDKDKSNNMVVMDDSDIEKFILDLIRDVKLMDKEFFDLIKEFRFK